MKNNPHNDGEGLENKLENKNRLSPFNCPSGGFTWQRTDFYLGETEDSHLILSCTSGQIYQIPTESKYKNERNEIKEEIEISTDL